MELAFAPEFRRATVGLAATILAMTLAPALVAAGDLNPPITIQGTVTDESGSPASVSVELTSSGLSAVAQFDETGSFTVTAVPGVNTLTLEGWHEGSPAGGTHFYRAYAEVIVDAEEPTMNLTVPDLITVSIQVTDLAGVPIQGALVNSHGNSEAVPFEVMPGVTATATVAPSALTGGDGLGHLITWPAAELDLRVTRAFPDYTATTDLLAPGLSPGTVDAVLNVVLPSPDAPTGLAVSPGDGFLRATWLPSPATGAQTTYLITAEPGGATCQTTTRVCYVTGLTNGVEYSVSASAFTGAGSSAASDPVLGTPDGATPTTSLAGPIPSGSLIDGLSPVSLPMTFAYPEAAPGGLSKSDIVLGGSSQALTPWVIGGISCNSGWQTCSFTVAKGAPATGTLTIQVAEGAQVTDEYSSPATNTVTYEIDSSSPTITAPVASLAAGSTVSSTVPVSLSWSGSDAGSGIANYEVWLSTDGGAYALVSSPTTAALTISLTASKTTTYRFRVHAIDNVGHVSNFAYSSVFNAKVTQQTSNAIRWRGTWHAASSSSASGGSYRYTGIAGRSASYTFTGRTIALVARTGTNFGSFKVYLDGDYKATVSGYATSTQWRHVLYSLNVSKGTHTIKLVCLGTSGHPRVSVDAFVVFD